MTEEEKKQVAVFRFGVISEFMNRVHLDHGEKERLLREKCARRWMIPFSEKTRIGRSTILRWIEAYKKKNGDLGALYPKGRSDRGKVRVLDEETCLGVVRVREEMPKAGVAKLIEEVEKRGLVTAGIRLATSTVYRFLHSNDLMGSEEIRAEDRRKFEARESNELWQSDVMHGPMVGGGEKKRKSYLIVLIDDHSRLVVHGEFYLTERLVSFMDAFEKALLRRGVPRKLYVDNGAAFRSRHLEYVTASLGIGLTHSRPYKPQGRGKIERFFRTVRSDFLMGRAIGTLEEINEGFGEWLKVYHGRKHGVTGQRPFERFTGEMECIRPAPKDLKDHFRKTVRRRVGKDRTIALNGKLYEAPVGLIGKRVEVLYHEQEPQRMEIRWKGKSWGRAHPVDVHLNCRVGRRKMEVKMEQKGYQYQSGRLWERKEEEE